VTGPAGSPGKSPSRKAGSRKPSVGIIINDYSNGNDILVATKDIPNVKALKGKKVGLEEGFVPHLLTLKALEQNGMSEKDIEIVNTATDKTPSVLKSGKVSAICAWQPNPGSALKEVPGSKAIFSSADAPGLIYDMLCVGPRTLKKDRADWVKVAKVWYKVVDFLKDEDNTDEALEILADRVKLKPSEYEPLLDGTYILSATEVKSVWEKGSSLKSIYGSTKISNDFNVNYDVYKTPLTYETYLDPSITMDALK